MNSPNHEALSNGAATEQRPLAIHSLVCHRDVRLAILGLGSLVRNSVRPVEIVFHDDGSLTEEDRRLLAKNLPVVRLWGRKEADAIADEALTRYPASRAYRHEQNYGLKLFDTILFEEQEAVAYCDTDILFLRRFRDLFTFPSPDVRLLLMSDREESYAARPWHLVGPNRLRLVRRTNAGLYFVKKAAFDFDFVEWFLQRPWSRRRWWLVEQTAWGGLGARMGCAVWDRRQVRIPLRRDFLRGADEQTVALHFIGGMRPWMSCFVPRLEGGESPIQTLRSSRAENLGPIALGSSQAWRKLKTLLRLSPLLEMPQKAPGESPAPQTGG